MRRILPERRVRGKGHQHWPAEGHSIARAVASERPTLRVHLALLAVQLFFAGFAVVGKAVLEVVPPLAIAGLRVLGATPLLFLVAARSGRPLPAIRDLPRLALLGLLGVTGNQVLFILGLQGSTATNASILMLAVPVFTVAVGALLALERPGTRQLGGVALAVVGALALLHPGRMVLAPDTVLGNTLMLANCLSYALFLVLQRPLLQRLPWSTVIAWAFLFGGLATLPLAWHDLARFPSWHLSGGAWVGVAYIILISTFLGYALSSWAMQRSSAALVAAYTTMQPVFGAALAAAFLGERMGWEEVVGFLLIAGGLRLVNSDVAAAAS